MTEYAMYRGDKFIDLGTLEYFSKKYGKKIETLRWKTYPSIHRKWAGTNRTLLYKIEDKEN